MNSVGKIYIIEIVKNGIMQVLVPLG
jgi:hypothetical protein